MERAATSKPTSHPHVKVKPPAPVQIDADEIIRGCERPEAPDPPPPTASVHTLVSDRPNLKLLQLAHQWKAKLAAGLLLVDDDGDDDEDEEGVENQRDGEGSKARDSDGRRKIAEETEQAPVEDDGESESQSGSEDGNEHVPKKRKREIDGLLGSPTAGARDGGERKVRRRVRGDLGVGEEERTAGD